MCNKPPKIPGNDEATWNRLRIIPFESTFTLDAPEDPEEQIRTKTFPMDKYFEQKLPDMAAPFYWILLQYFKKFKKEGLDEPEEITIDTEKYKTENDIFAQFVQEKIQKTRSKKDTLTAASLFVDFKDWYEEFFPQYSKKSLPSMSAFVTEISQRLRSRPIGKKWVGFRIKLDIEDEEDDTIDSVAEGVMSYFSKRGLSGEPVSKRESTREEEDDSSVKFTNEEE